MGSKIAVKIENKTFNSLKEACEFLKIQNVAGLAHAINKGNTRYKGLNIERISAKPTGNKTNHKQKSCPVICETLNKRFKTIKAAAEYAQVDQWTMSKKMTTAGQFKDKDGNIYKRLKPMNSKNVYENTGDTLKCKRAFAHRTVSKPVYNQPVQVLDTKPEEVLKPAQPKLTINKNELAKKILKEKAMEFINNNNFEVAISLLDVAKDLN